MSQRITLEHIARIASVSKATVSRVLRDDSTLSVSQETRKRVWQAARETGYLEQSQKVRPGDSTPALRVGLVLAPSGPLADTPYYATLLETVQNSLAGLGVELSLLMRGKDVDSRGLFTRAASPPQVEGILVLGALSETALQLLEQRFRHLVIVSSSSYRNDQRFRVAVDHPRSVVMAVEHLARLGYRRIAYLGPLQDLRWFGYQMGMLTIGSSPESFDAMACTFSADSARAAVRERVRAGQLPEAIVVASDVLAMAAVKELHGYGIRVPDDVALVGHDDLFAGSLLTPAITTVQVPVKAMGEEATRLLLERIAGLRAEPVHIFLPTRLIIRDTCGSGLKNPA